MGFPSISVVKEDFAGAAATLVSGNWAQGRQNTTPVARDGAGLGKANVAGFCSSRWTPASFLDVEVFVDLSTLSGTADEWVAIYTRQQGTGTDAYEFSLNRTGASSWSAQIWDKKAGSFVSRASSVVAWAAGNKFGARTYTDGSGNVVNELWRHDGTSWGSAPLVTWTDSAVNKILLAGEVELEMQNVTGRIDNFVVGAMTRVTKMTRPAQIPVASRREWPRRFPRQGWDGARQRDSTGKVVPTYGRFLGPQPPEIILPLPLQSQQTVRRVLNAVATRLSMRRRFPPQWMEPSSRGFERAIGPDPPAVISAGGGTTFTDNVTGSAAPDGSVVEQKIYTESISGSAAPSGSATDSVSVLSLAQMTVRVVRASDLLRRKARVRYQRRLTAVQGVTVLTDVVSGAASPTGSVVESWSVLSLSQMTVRVVRAADALKRKARVRYQRRLTLSAGITFLTDAPVGSASPSGTIVEQKLYTDAVSGSAAPSGSVVESSSVLTLAQMTIRVRKAADLLRRKARVRYQRRLTINAGVTTTSDAPTGSAAPSGSIVESKTGTDAVSGSASPAGSVVESASTLTLGQMTVRVRRAADLVTRRLRIRYQHRLTSIGGVTTIADAPTGSESPSGTASDALTHASSPSGTATAAGSSTDARILSDAVTGAASASGSVSDGSTGGDSVSGTSSPSGSLTQSLTHSSAVTGSAAPSGSVVESSFRGFADSPSGSAAPSGSASDAAIYADSVTGAASPSGNASDSYAPPAPTGPVPGVGGVPERVRLARLQRPRLYVDEPIGYAVPFGYVRETWIVLPTIESISDEDEMLLLGLL